MVFAVPKMFHVRVGALIATVVLLSACGSSTGGVSQASSTPTVAVTASPSPLSTPSTAPLACTSAGAASSSWPGPASRTSTNPPIVSASALGDTLTLTFDQGTPQFDVTPQADTHFVKDPSGMAVDLAGTAGVKIVLRGFRGDMRNYTGPVSAASNGPRLLQVYELGDFEGVVTWAVGVNGGSCASATIGTASLTFQFIATPA